MIFPDTQRSVYGKSTLVQVLCQLRFPPILRVSQESPADFQERIRAQFPEYRQTAEWNLSMPAPISPVALGIGAMGPVIEEQSARHQFLSEDGAWKITLGRDSLSLATTKYERWEVFRERLQAPIAALSAVYRPNYFSRIGLRYVNVFSRENLGLKDTPWTKLLQPHILGIMGDDKVADNVNRFENQYELNLDEEKSRLNIKMSYAMHHTTNEKAFLIDSDFSKASKMTTEAAEERLEFFHEQASRLIRWCITEDLHQAMEPRTI